MDRESQFVNSEDGTRTGERVWPNYPRSSKRSSLASYRALNKRNECRKVELLSYLHCLLSMAIYTMEHEQSSRM